MNFQKCFAITSGCLIISFFSFAGNTQKAITLKDIYKTGKIEFVPVMKISKESVTNNILFKKVSSVCWLQDRLYILDTDCSNIKVFTADGRFLKTFGKGGSRESELSLPYRINVIDGHLVVWEAKNQRFSIFNADGEFKHTLKPFKKGFVENFDSLGNGNMVIERIGYGAVGDDVYELVMIELYSKNFQLIKELYRKQILQFHLIRIPGKNPVNLPLPFQPQVSWHILPGIDGKNTNKVVIGCSDSYSIDIIDTETGISRTFSHPYSSVKVSEADRNIYFNSFVKYDKDGNAIEHGADRILLDNTTFPEYKPVFKRLIADYEGNILVFSYTGSDNGKYSKSATEFDAFDTDGQFINHVKIANDVEIHILRFYSAKDRIFWGLSSGTGIPVGINKYAAN